MDQKLTPIEIARQTLLTLSKSHNPPTPENYSRVYDEIAGTTTDHSVILVQLLDKILLEKGKHSPRHTTIAKRISSALKRQDVAELEVQLLNLMPKDASIKDETNGIDVNWGTLLRHLLKQLDTNHSGITLSRKKESLNRVIINFGNDHSLLGQKVQALVTCWGEGQPTGIETNGSNDNESHIVAQNALLKDSVQHPHSTTQSATMEFSKANQDDSKKLLTSVWRDMLIRTIKLTVLPQFAGIPSATKRVEELVKCATFAETLDEVNKLSGTLKSTLLRAEMQSDSQHRMQDALIEILRLLVSSMVDLSIEDQWLHAQIKIVQEIISKPLKIEAVYSAESSLKELIFKQSHIKTGLTEAKETLRNMVSTFVTRLADISISTGAYKSKIQGYHDQINATDDISELSTILESLVGDISEMSADAKQSHDALQETQKKVANAEKQINELTAKLDFINEAAHEDFLTGALNRRGMDDAIKTEFERADRHDTPLSFAMLDIDHFKKINDTLGHATGDKALAHLAKVVKSILRSTDVLARYGGEEFVILLPGSNQADALTVVTGLQRELTKNFFLHNNERVLITFSAGVTERLAGENIDAVLPRADAALYQAKQSGRNRVFGALEADKNQAD